MAADGMPRPGLERKDSFVAKRLHSVFAKGGMPGTASTLSRMVTENFEAKTTSLFRRDSRTVRNFRTTAAEVREIYNDSCCGKIAKSKMFEYVTLGVIVVNACVIGWDIDFQARFGKPEDPYDTEGDANLVIFAVLDNFFTVYFAGEILVRFLAYAKKSSCLRDAWFIFDAALVQLMLLETWVLPLLGGSGNLSSFNIFRMLRLMRITRLVKLMRAFPQLMMIVKGITQASKAVVWTLALLLIITFTWAIMFTNEYHQGKLTDEDINELPEGDPAVIHAFFGSMGKSMLSLLVMGTILDDVTACTDAIRATDNLGMLLAFVIYILLNSFTMMNMLVGVLVEVVGSTAEAERSNLKEKNFQESLTNIFNTLDGDKSGVISRDEFVTMRSHEKVKEALKEMDINDKHFDQYVQLLFSSSEQEEREEAEREVAEQQQRDRARISGKAVEEAEEMDDNDSSCSVKRGAARSDGRNLSFKELLDCICRLRPGTCVSALDFAAFKQSVCEGQDGLKDRLQLIESLCEAFPQGPAGSQKSQAKGTPKLPVTQSILRAPTPSPTCHLEAVTAPGIGRERDGSNAANVGSEASILRELERVPPADIMNEIQRRLNVVSPKKPKPRDPLQPAMRPLVEDEPQMWVRKSEAFQPFLIDKPSWSKQTVTC